MNSLFLRGTLLPSCVLVEVDKGMLKREREATSRTFSQLWSYLFFNGHYLSRIVMWPHLSEWKTSQLKLTWVTGDDTPLKLTWLRTWKWMVGRRSFPFGARPIFRGVLVSFRECISLPFFCGKWPFFGSAKFFLPSKKRGWWVSSSPSRQPKNFSPDKTTLQRCFQPRKTWPKGGIMIAAQKCSNKRGWFLSKWRQLAFVKVKCKSDILESESGGGCEENPRKKSFRNSQFATSPRFLVKTPI